jgi:hypothetical protein
MEANGKLFPMEDVPADTALTSAFRIVALPNMLEIVRRKSPGTRRETRECVEHLRARLPWYYIQRLID